MTTVPPVRRLTWIRYGASELKRVYRKNMTLGLGVSVTINLLVFGSLWLFFHEESGAVSHRIVRIRRYADLQLPVPTRMRQFGLSAYPTLPSTPWVSDQAAYVPVIRSLPEPTKFGASAGRQVRPAPGDLGGLPTPDATDKMRADEGGKEIRDFNGRSLQATRDDIAGGGGTVDRVRRGGNPVAGNRGDSPGGLDRSGIGSSAKPSAGTVPYGTGSGPGGGGTGAGGEGYSLQWLMGNVRRKISGELPKYPDGVTVEAQVRIRAVVLPDGGVKSAQPEQKGDSRLENAAMREVKLWRFEPLPQDVPQAEQTCVVSFLFKLR